MTSQSAAKAKSQEGAIIVGYDPIDSFDGPNRWLSNFWPVPGGVRDNVGLLYPTVEHAYQASKTFDRETREAIAALPTPGAAKRRGQEITSEAGMREDWQRVKLSVMLALLRRKFWPTTELGNRLMGTHPAELIEGNTWGDIYWGVCNGVGHNHLGQLLAFVRDELRSQALILGDAQYRPDRVGRAVRRRARAMAR